MVVLEAVPVQASVLRRMLMVLVLVDQIVLSVNVHLGRIEGRHRHYATSKTRRKPVQSHQLQSSLITSHVR